MPSPSHPHTTERIAVAREAHWSTRLLDFDPRPLEAIFAANREARAALYEQATTLRMSESDLRRFNEMLEG